MSLGPQRVLQGTVAAESLRRSEEELAALAAEAARLRAAMDGMVPAARHAAVQVCPPLIYGTALKTCRL